MRGMTVLSSAMECIQERHQKDGKVHVKTDMAMGRVAVEDVLNRMELTRARGPWPCNKKDCGRASWYHRGNGMTRWFTCTRCGQRRPRGSRENRFRVRFDASAEESHVRADGGQQQQPHHQGGSASGAAAGESTRCSSLKPATVKGNATKDQKA